MSNLKIVQLFFLDFLFLFCFTAVIKHVEQEGPWTMGHSHENNCLKGVWNSPAMNFNRSAVS